MPKNPDTPARPEKEHIRLPQNPRGKVEERLVPPPVAEPIQPLVPAIQKQRLSPRRLLLSLGVLGTAATFAAIEVLDSGHETGPSLTVDGSEAKLSDGNQLQRDAEGEEKIISEVTANPSLNPPTESAVPHYTAVPWVLADRSQKGTTTCPDRATWLEAWDKESAVAVLMVECEDGEVYRICPVYSKKGAEKVSIGGGKTKKPMKIKPYDLFVDSYATVCADHESEDRVVYKMQILGE